MNKEFEQWLKQQDYSLYIHGTLDVLYVQWRVVCRGIGVWRWDEITKRGDAGLWGLANKK